MIVSPYHVIVQALLYIRKKTICLVDTILYHLKNEININQKTFLQPLNQRNPRNLAFRRVPHQTKEIRNRL